MTEPLSTIVAAKILDQLLGQAIGKSVDGLLGGASQALKDARAELDKETAQRAVRLTLIVQKAAEELQPALEQIKLETGQDHSALFEHLPFLAQIADALLFGTRLDLPALQAQYMELYSDERWPGLSRPLIKFFERLNRLLEAEEPWKSALLEFRIEAQIAGLNANTLQLVETAEQIARELGALPEQITTALERREIVRLDAWEQRYLVGLYAECNELPLASDAPPDVAQQRRAPRLQRVYVDLDIDQRLTLDRVLDRLEVPPSRRKQVRMALMGLGPAEMGQRAWEGELPDELTRGLSSRLRQGEALGGEERTAKLKQLGIEPEALAQALKPVTAFEAIGENRQMVLLGDPGSGKSTLTRRVAGLLASVAVEGLEAQDRDWQSGLGHAYGHWHTPLRITLSRWATRLPAKAGGVADDLIKECLHVLREAGNVGDDRVGTYLADQLNAVPPRALILLDGLDEVPDPKRREKLLAAVRDFCQTYHNVPLLVTCRVRPYSEDASYRLPLPAFKLAPLSEDSVAAFLQRWHDELVAADLYQPPEAVQARRRLQEAIADRDRPELREMTGTPLLLTMMVRVNYAKGLPGSRAMLYETYVNQLLYEWEKRKQDDHGAQTDLERLVIKDAGLDIPDLNRVLNKLAYDAHGQKGGRDTVDIPRQRVREALEALYLTKHQGQEAAAAAWAVKVLQFIDARSGLLQAREMGKLYYFAHRTFQEYLAARWMASSEALERIVQKIDDPNWREVVLLAFGYQIFKLEQPDSALPVLHELMPPAVTSEVKRRQTLLLGEAYVRLLEPYRARQSAHQKAATELMTRTPELLRQAMQRTALDATSVDVKILARQRLDAGLLLADLNPETPAMDDFVPIPDAGFDIGRYPVTNREFRRFVDAGGYDQDKPWWSEQAKKEILDFERQYGEGKWPTASRYWKNSRLNRPTQPVVGISWYEAKAYCAWLTGELQGQGHAVEVRLPTTEEWRQAAGSERYPWGKDFDPANANTVESGLSEPTPVDMYPDGVTSEGVWDIAGNVWEWTNTRYTGVSVEAYDLAGGSWWNGASGVGSSARDKAYPRDGDDDFGLRVVVVPISHSG